MFADMRLRQGEAAERPGPEQLLLAVPLALYRPTLEIVKRKKIEKPDCPTVS